ncbi:MULTISPECIES: hypothetical protein, partial [unclassified Neptuniibacter]
RILGSYHPAFTLPHITKENLAISSNRCNVIISGDTMLIPTSIISSYHVEYIEEKMIGIMTWILENNGFILEAIVMGAIIVYIGRKI